MICFDVPVSGRAPDAVISSVCSRPTIPEPGMPIFGSMATTMPCSSGAVKPLAKTGVSSTVRPMPCPKNGTLSRPNPIKPSICPSRWATAHASAHISAGTAPGFNAAAVCSKISTHTACALRIGPGIVSAAPLQYTCVLSVLYPSTLNPISMESKARFCQRRSAFPINGMAGHMPLQPRGPL